MLADSSSPFRYLAELDRDYRALPATLGDRHWGGIALRLGGCCLLAPLDEISEVMAVPRLTPMPGLPAYVQGVAHLRGRVLPVVDTAALLGIGRVADGRHLLVVTLAGRAVGLRVDEVLGLRYFHPEQRIDHAADLTTALRASELSEIPTQLSPFVSGAYRADAIWLIVSPRLVGEHADLRAAPF